MMMQDVWVSDDVPSDAVAELAPNGSSVDDLPVLDQINSLVQDADRETDRVAVALSFDNDDSRWVVDRSMEMSGRTCGMPDPLVVESDLYLVVDCLNDRPDVIISARRLVDRVVS